MSTRDPTGLPRGIETSIGHGLRGGMLAAAAAAMGGAA